MTGWKIPSELRETALGYSVTLLLCLAALTGAMRLWRADLSVPFQYVDTDPTQDRDFILGQALVKATLQSGWNLRNNFLGAPFGQDLHDFPTADHLHHGVILLLGGLISRDFATIFNLFFLIGFPLAALSSLWVCRRLQISWGPAILCSLLFAFAPYHFARGPRHLFLSSYYMIPPMVLVLLWIMQDRLHLAQKNEATGKLQWFGCRREIVASAIICVLVAGAGVYYAFFACMFLVMAGSWSAVQQRRWQPLLTTGCCIALISFVLGLLLSPTLLYVARNGRNPEAVARLASESEIYGLRISNLFQPSSGHPLARFLAEVNSHELVNYLGVIGGVGFLLLILRLLLVRFHPDDLLDALAVLNGTAILVATCGGFGGLFNQLVTSWIRCYCRIGIYIAFFSFLAAAILLDQVVRHSWSRRSILLLVGGLTMIGLLDQSKPGFVPHYAENKRAFASDATFVQTIEQSLPQGSMIFQLPIAQFPEGLHFHQLNPYDHLAGYLHSRNLRWSYGAMRGRFGDRWQTAQGQQNRAGMLRDLVLAGFAGIQIDRLGYPDGGAAIENQLRQLLEVDALVSPDQRKVFFSLSNLADKLHRKHDPEEWARLRAGVLNPVFVHYGYGFYGPEDGGVEYFQWCGTDGVLQIENPTTAPRKVSLRWSYVPGAPGQTAIRISSPLLVADMKIGSHGAEECYWDLNVPPGRHLFQLHSDDPPLRIPGDPRLLVFRVQNLRVSP